MNSSIHSKTFVSKISYYLFSKLRNSITIKSIYRKIPFLIYLRQSSYNQIKNFDRDFYLSMNPDIYKQKLDPFVHFVRHGRYEGRAGSPPPLILSGKSNFLPDKENVLVVSHDASRTGAPILAWNICKELSANYNVIALLLGPGELVKNFEEICSLVCGPYENTIKDHHPSVYYIVKQLCDVYAFKFSIVNSIVSRNVLPKLNEKFIPSVLLIHEFSAYVPIEMLNLACVWARTTVFPAEIVRQSTLNETTQYALSQSSNIIPQGNSLIPSSSALNPTETKSEFEIFLESYGENKPFIVLGAGAVQYRKGVDLFIATVKEIKRLNPSANIVLIWVGEIPGHERLYKGFIEEQIKHIEEFKNFKLFSSMENFEEIYKHVQVLYLPSRLDPLPNVAIDAMLHGLPILCFEHSSGISDFLSENPDTNSCILPHSNIHAAAEKIIELFNSEIYYKKISQQNQKIALENFNMSNYVSKLINLAEKEKQRLLQEEIDLKTIAESNDFDENFYTPPHLRVNIKNQNLHYIKAWHSKIHMRKPAPGFKPYLYAEFNNLEKGIEPFAHYIRSGKPEGKWQEKLISPDLTLKKFKAPKCAVHIHVFYPELFTKIFFPLLTSNIEFDCYVSVPSTKVEEAIRQLIPKSFKNIISIKVVPNKGRDIGPFLTEFGQILRTYEVIGHFHTKKSQLVDDSKVIDLWVNFLLENLIGSNSLMFLRILKEFQQDETLGLVYADDPNIMGWGKNKSYAEELIKKFKEPCNLPEGNFNFPVGTMFWARPAALKPLFDLKLQWKDYPEEPLPYDGSMLHAIERLIPLIVEQQKFNQKVTFVPGISR